MAHALFRELLTAIRERLSANDRGDATAVVDSQALVVADQLASTVAPDEKTALEARGALALFWWYRFWALPSGRNLTELHSAARLITDPGDPVIRQLPAEFTALLEVDRELSGAPTDWAESATEILAADSARRHPAEFDRSIGLLRIAVQATEIGAPVRAVFLANQAIIRLLKYGSTGHPTDLDAAIDATRTGIDALGPDDPAVAVHYADLALLLRARFAATRSAVDLDAAITAGRDAVASDSPHRAVMLSGLGVALRLRFALDGELADLDEAIEAGREAASAMAADDPERTVTLTNLALALEERSTRIDSDEDLDEAVKAGLAATADLVHCRHVVQALSTLARSLFLRFERTGAVADLDQAEGTVRALLKLIADDHPERAAHESILCEILRARYAGLGKVDDLTAVVNLRRKLLAASAHYDAGKLAQRQLELAIELDTRFDATGARTDLVEAVLLFAQAVSADPTVPPSQRPQLSLPVFRLTEYARTGDRAGLLDQVLTRELRTLVEAGTQAAPDLTVLCVAGWLHWLRFQTWHKDQEKEATADLRSAASAFYHVYLLAPSAVPPAIADTYQHAEYGTAASSGQDLDKRLNAEAVHLSQRYNASGDLGLLRESVRLFQRAAALATEPAEWVASVHNNLGLALLTLAQEDLDRSTIQDAVAASQAAVTLSAPQAPYLPGRLSLLCGALKMLSDNTGDPAALDKAIEAGRRGVSLTPKRHPSRGLHLSNLAIALLGRHKHTGAGKDLQEAVKLLRLAAPALAPGNRHRVTCLHNLGDALQRLGQETGQLAVLIESVQVKREALELVPSGPLHWKLLDALSAALIRVYDRTDQLELLEEAITRSREALMGTDADAPTRAGRIMALVTALRQWHQQTGELSALREAVDALRNYTANLAAAGPDEGRCLALLGLILPDLVTVDGYEVLEEAVSALRRAVAMTPADNKLRGVHATSLASALTSQHRHTGNTAALLEAVQVAKDAFTAGTLDEDSRRHGLDVLVNALTTLNEITGETAALDEAIRWADAALAGDADAKGQVARARLLFRRGMSIGEVTEIEKAIRIVREILVQPDSDNIPYIADLGLMLMSIYRFTGVLAVILEAIDVLRRSLKEDQSEPWISRNSLAQALREFYDRTGDEAVLKEAVELMRQAATEIPPTYPYRSVYLGNLGEVLMQLSKVTSNASLLEEGVDAARAAVLAATVSPAYRPDHLMTLSQALLGLFEHTGDVQTLREAVEVSRDTVRESSQLHVNRVKHLVGLGLALLRQHRHDGDVITLQEAAEILSSASRLSTGTLEDRINSGQLWGDAAMLQQDAAQALAAYEYTVGLVLQRAGPSLARTDREYGLEKAAGLPSKAAAAAIAAGDPGRAIELLERARGVLLGEALHFRADISQLEARIPDLANEFRRVGQELTALQRQPADQYLLAPVGTVISGVSGELQPPVPQAAERRAALADHFTRLSERIRAVPGFADFLSSPSLPAVQAAIGPGPVVIVNASRWRCDALLVTPDAVDVLPLPELSLSTTVDRANQYLQSIQEHEHLYQAVFQLRQRITGGGHTSSSFQRYHALKVALQLQSETMEATLRTTLAWLWDTVVEPILERLGHTAPPAEDGIWPRIWWCPIGPLTLLPLHAAGHHGMHMTANGQAVMDRVVSSYAPSLRALIEARREPADSPAEDARMLITALPTRLDQAPLPNAARERDFLRRLFPAQHSTVLTGDAATRETVLSSLPHHLWAHFSCHGDQPLAEPSRGGLLLADGTLTVTDIGAGQYRGELAFLSACKTAAGSVILTDEAITLAAALQYAGYRHVVATSWSVYDTTAADVAEETYDRLVENGVLRTAHVASALHQAIRRLRRQYPDRPSVWMPFTHLGP